MANNPSAHEKLSAVLDTIEKDMATYAPSPQQRTKDQNANRPKSPSVAVSRPNSTNNPDTKSPHTNTSSTEFGAINTAEISALARALSLPAALVAKRMANPALMAQFTVAQLKIVNRHLCHKFNKRHKSHATKSAWIENTCEILFLPVSVPPPVREVSAPQVRNEPSARNSSPVENESQDRSELPDRIIESINQTPLATSHRENTHKIKDPLTFENRNAEIKVPSKYTPGSHQITVLDKENVASKIANKPMNAIQNIRNNESMINTPSTPTREKARSFETPNSVNSHRVRRLLMANNSPALQSPTPIVWLPPPPVESTSASPFRNPLLFRPIPSNSPAAKKNVAKQPTTPASPEVALGRSLDWNPTPAHYGALLKLTKQIPETFHIYNDFSCYIHSESKSANKGGRQLSLSFFLTKPICDVLELANQKLCIFIQLEANNPMMENTFGLPIGTIVHIKIDDDYTRAVTVQSNNHIVDIARHFTENKSLIVSAAEELKGSVVKVVVVLPSPHLAPINTLIVGIRRLTFAEATLKILQRELYARGIKQEQQQHDKLSKPPFWTALSMYGTIADYKASLSALTNLKFGRSLSQSLLENENEIEVGETTLSFMCPLSLLRIDVPGRGRRCQHLQCFDVQTFLQFQENNSQWKCVICGKVIKCNDLIVVPRMLMLLRKYLESDRCIVKPDGTDIEWTAENGDSDGTSGNDAMFIEDSDEEDAIMDRLFIKK
ncbi:SUMO ligase siz1 [Physocladia obscura]|uniref:SUMO ligase siz1 n=1 Tax=Physocladia obscura TaxID=109957 RepID=A0AAD5XDV2_9FUNG|nr:SUMO ligase siz1 [Physocladia obscura]